MSVPILKIKLTKYVVEGYKGYWTVTRVDLKNHLVEAVRTDFTFGHGKQKVITKLFKAESIIKEYKPKKERKMRVAFTGASGSGKTTLVHYLEESSWKLPWLNGSSGQIKSAEQNAVLSKMGLSVGKGHAGIITSGHLNPPAAVRNQEMILENRMKLYSAQERFVTDRSPIDSWVYYLMQVSMYCTDAEVKAFWDKCHEATKKLTHIIFVPTMLNPIENNGSRIPVWEYQLMCSGIFERAVEKMEQHSDIQILKVQSYSLTERKAEIDEFLDWTS